MLPDRVSNPGPLIYESGALPIAVRGPAIYWEFSCRIYCSISKISHAILSLNGKQNLLHAMTIYLLIHKVLMV